MPTVLRFIQPCLPSPADRPPSGSNWIHEIKHDGYRLMARRDSVGIRLITRRGNDWSGPGSRYRSGRSPDWLKFKNPEAPAAKREAEEDADYRYPQSLQGSVAQTPRLAFSGFREIDDLFGDRVAGRTDGPVGALEDHKGHFESDAHETDRLGVKSMAV
jgi:hypothetical protein